jgi:hypothetical protein
MFEGDFLILPEALETVYFNPQNFIKVITKNISSQYLLALPNSDYFPGFEVAISYQQDDGRYLALLQVTTADKHSLSNEGLTLLVKAHGTGVFKQIIIVYVLPSRHKLASFGLQKLESKAIDNTVFNETSQVTLSISVKKKIDEDVLQKKRKHHLGNTQKKKTRKKKRAKNDSDPPFESTPV